MIKLKRIISSILCFLTVLSFCSCKRAENGSGYLKENAGGTGYGAGIKSALYIDDFYFVNKSTLRSAVELVLGSPHFTEEGNDTCAVYDLNNGDSIELNYNKEKGTVDTAKYTYADGTTASFFDILVELGILKSSVSESGDTTVDIPGSQITQPDSGSQTQTPDSGQTIPSEQPTQSVIQGDVFATGMYNYYLIEPSLGVGVPRTSIIASVGKPNYYFSQDFAPESYIIDCYNLNDGSKLYLDYGYARDNLRCAAIYKNGTYTSILSSKWLAQVKPSGFTRKTVSSTDVGRLTLNLTPAKVYKKIGEPAWYEGSRGNYTDVYALTDGGYAYLNFGSAHNKLTSLSIKGADGTTTVIPLNK